MDRAFWSAPHRWPPDTSEHVFLARAYDQIGRARFPDDWTGEEAVTSPPRQERKVRGWSEEPVSDHILSVIVGKPPAWVTDAPEKVVTPAEELSESERADRIGAIFRSSTIVQLILEKAAASDLVLAYLPIDNNTPFCPCPEAWWHTRFKI